MREIVLDTETTGFKPEEGHRIVEIGCLEIIQNIPTGQSLQLYLNPERDMPEAAFKVHGLGNDFLADKPLFTAVVDDFLSFIGDDPLVIHNAGFDLKFLNAELVRAGRAQLSNKAIDTVLIARELFPGAPANLDALCRRFDIDNSARRYHGALLDCELLAEVYLELRGGRQRGLALTSQGFSREQGENKEKEQKSGFAGGVRPARVFELSAQEQQAHAQMLSKLTNPIWLSGGEQ